ncbi:MAG TPA: MFS transporter, partial [Thermoprotei archaeon]|nr:MFS transporter [Thermoprotei archaeon]
PFHFIVAPYLFNVDPGYIALAAFLERGVSMLSSVPIGWLSDRIGDKRVILIFSEAMLSIGILFYIYPYLGVSGFLASTFFIGLGTASYAPIVSALVSELSPDNPEDAVGFLLTAISLSRLPGSIVIGPLMAILGYGGGFTFTLICLGIVGLGLFIHYLKSSSLPIK